MRMRDSILPYSTRHNVNGLSDICVLYHISNDNRIRPVNIVTPLDCSRANILIQNCFHCTRKCEWAIIHRDVANTIMTFSVLLKYQMRNWNSIHFNTWSTHCINTSTFNSQYQLLIQIDDHYNMYPGYYLAYCIMGTHDFSGSSEHKNTALPISKVL